MQEIVESVRRVTDIMGEISAASREQTAGIEQINQAVVQMDQGTQQNAALVEEAAAASASMQEQAAKLAEAVSVFRIGAIAEQGTSSTLGASSVASLGGSPGASPGASKRPQPALAVPKPALARPVPVKPLAKSAPAKEAVSAGEWEEF